MSAMPCGCDDAAGWICKQHGDELEAGRVRRFAERLAAEAAKDTTPSLSAEQIEALIWRNDRRHIADILATFYRAPLSMSSVQPLLTLAEELNPGLKR